jgi:hypothetical protein
MHNQTPRAGEDLSQLSKAHENQFIARAFVELKVYVLPGYCCKLLRLA